MTLRACIRRWGSSAARAWSPSPSRSSSRATRASTTRSRSTAGWPWTSPRTTTRTCSRRCGPGGSRRSSSPPNRIEVAPEYSELRDLGRKVIAALGIGTSATHMEWFFGPKGLKFSEIGCRPPGVGAWDLYSAGNDMDIYTEWANAVIHGETATAPSRRYASGMVALRPGQDGSITGYSGVEELQRQFGEW